MKTAPFDETTSRELILRPRSPTTSRVAPSVRVRRDDLAPVAGAEGPPGLRADRILDRADRVVAHQQVDDPGGPARGGQGTTVLVVVSSVAAAPGVRDHHVVVPRDVGLVQEPVGAWLAVSR